MSDDNPDRPVALVASVAGHATWHFDARGYCHCPCEECSTSLRFCICKECQCLATSGGHAGEVDWSAGIPGVDLEISDEQPPCETDSSVPAVSLPAVSSEVASVDDGRDTAKRSVSRPTSSGGPVVGSPKIG